MELEWDDANIEHIARHGISPDEVEEVCNDPRRITVGHRRVGSQRRHSVMGPAESGRMIVVVLVPAGRRHWRAITARDAIDRELRTYRRKQK